MRYKRLLFPKGMKEKKIENKVTTAADIGATVRKKRKKTD
jgi:hypothetical protein